MKTEHNLHTFDIPNRKELNEILQFFKENNARYYPVRRGFSGWKVTLDENSPLVSYLTLKYTKEATG